MAVKHGIDDLFLIESDINIAFNLLEHLYLEICEKAPTSELKENPKAFHINELSWNQRADYIQAMTKGVVAMLDEVKLNIHSVVEEIDKKWEEEHKQCQATS